MKALLILALMMSAAAFAETIPSIGRPVPRFCTYEDATRKTFTGESYGGIPAACQIADDNCQHESNTPNSCHYSDCTIYDQNASSLGNVTGDIIYDRDGYQCGNISNSGTSVYNYAGTLAGTLSANKINNPNGTPFGTVLGSSIYNLNGTVVGTFHGCSEIQALAASVFIIFEGHSCER